MLSHLKSISLLRSLSTSARRIYIFLCARPEPPCKPGHARAGWLVARRRHRVRAEAEASNAPSTTNPTPVPGAPAAPSLSPADVHVLLVDDERMQRMVVASLLRKCSYKGE